MQLRMADIVISYHTKPNLLRSIKLKQSVNSIFATTNHMARGQDMFTLVTHTSVQIL